jgi:F0F1-type ATP synthase epsilon subunit
MAIRQDASTGQLVDDGKKTSEQTQSGSAGKQTEMHVKVYSPFHTYYDEPALSLSAENATGPFDVLPHHHNFITLLQACELTVRSATRGEVNIRISGGLMHVRADNVTVFLNV